MARPVEFTQQNTELAMQAANVSMNWFRQIAQQNLKQSKASLEELLGLTRRMTADFGNQASAICEHSMSLSEKMVSNTLDYGFKVARLREPQELVQVQTDFLSRQAQAFADQAKELNERFAKGAEELANTFAESTRRQSKAA
jgi:hypothetical protein